MLCRCCELWLAAEARSEVERRLRAKRPVAELVAGNAGRVLALREASQGRRRLDEPLPAAPKGTAALVRWSSVDIFEF